jgi:mRNA interferase MazF
MQKIRPCVVVSSDLIGKLPLRVVVPLTGWNDGFKAAPWLVRVDPSALNGMEKTSAADAFQVRSVSVERFVRRKGVLEAPTMSDIAAAIGIVIELTI